MCIYNLKLVVTLEQGGKSYGFADLHGRRKKEKEKKKIHPLNTTDEVKMAMSCKKKIFQVTLPKFKAQLYLQSERCTTNRAEQHQLNLQRKDVKQLIVPKPKTITHKELHKLAREARGYAKKIYLHWTAGNYNDAYDDYHFNIGKDGELYITCKTLLETKFHTFNRNKESVSIALCCCAEGRLYGHGRVDFGEQPPTPVQLEKMSQVIAILAHALEIDITFSNVMTHAEAAFIDGYGPGSGDKEMRWDLWYLPDLPFNRAMRPGGTALREKAQWYYDYYFKSEMFN